MFLNTVHHVAIIVSDYELSRDFYVDKLGFEIIRENHRPERHDYKLDLRCGDIELEIFGNKTSDPNNLKTKFIDIKISRQLIIRNNNSNMVHCI